MIDSVFCETVHFPHRCRSPHLPPCLVSTRDYEEMDAAERRRVEEALNRRDEMSMARRTRIPLALLASDEGDDGDRELRGTSARRRRQAAAAAGIELAPGELDDAYDDEELINLEETKVGRSVGREWRFVADCSPGDVEKPRHSPLCHLAWRSFNAQSPPFALFLLRVRVTCAPTLRWTARSGRLRGGSRFSLNRTWTPGVTRSTPSGSGRCAKRIASRWKVGTCAVFFLGGWCV